jgi:hypothetical protein
MDDARISLPSFGATRCVCTKVSLLCSLHSMTVSEGFVGDPWLSILLTLCHILHSVSHWPVLVYFISMTGLKLDDRGWGPLVYSARVSNVRSCCTNHPATSCTTVCCGLHLTSVQQQTAFRHPTRLAGSNHSSPAR